MLFKIGLKWVETDDFLLLSVWCWGWDGAGDLDGPDVDPIWERMSPTSQREEAVRIRHNRSFKMH